MTRTLKWTSKQPRSELKELMAQAPENCKLSVESTEEVYQGTYKHLATLLACHEHELWRSMDDPQVTAVEIQVEVPPQG